VIFIEQYFGPCIEQKWATLVLAGSVSSWNSRAVSRSSDRVELVLQRNSKRAFDSASSHSPARGWPLAAFHALESVGLRAYLGLAESVDSGV
jgi:hypothetical protein